MRRLLLFAAALLLASPLFAQQTCAELVPKIMEASGLNASLDTMPDAMRQATQNFSTREGNIDVAKKRAFEDILLHSFDKDRMAKNIHAKLLASCDPVAYSTALEQMESPLGRKFKAMELQPHSTPEEGVKMQRFVASFPMQSPREARLRLIQNLMDTTGLVNKYATLSLTVSSEMARIIRTAPTSQQMEMAREQLIPMIQQATEAETYYTYRSASDQELQQYIAMQASKNHQRLGEDVYKALLAAVVIEADDMAHNLKARVVDAKAMHEGE